MPRKAGAKKKSMPKRIKKAEAENVVQKAEEPQESPVAGSAGKQKAAGKKIESKGTPFSTKILLAAVFAVIAIFFAYKFIAVSEAKSAQQKCLDIQNDPMLKYPCKCVPTARPDNANDIVDAKSNPMCTCVCDFGAGGKKVIEIRASK